MADEAGTEAVATGDAAPNTDLTGGIVETGEGQGDQQSGDKTTEGDAVGDKPADKTVEGDEAAKGGDKADGKEPKDGEGGEASSAPEQYADFTVPEGYELSGDMLEGVTSFAKANKLTQEQAQAVVDLGAQQAKALMDQVIGDASKNPVLLAKYHAGQWHEQTVADPEIGGAKLKDTMALATKVLNTFGTPELFTYLTQTGQAHHPELIRLLHKFGGAVSEDTLVTPSGGGKAVVGADPAKKLYPAMA